MSDSTPEPAAPDRPDATRRLDVRNPRSASGQSRRTPGPGARTSIWVTALALPPLALLAAAAWFGRSVRPGADDWCFLPVVRDHGVTGLIGRFYFDDNGRVANAVLVGAYAKFQVAGHQWFGLVSGVLILTVLWAATVLALRRLRLTVPHGLPLLVSAMATALFLFVTPNTYKTFYW